MHFINPAVDCSRPVIFYNDDPEFPFSQCGTCALLRFRKRLWVITAKHILNLGYKPSDVFIPVYAGADYSIPLLSAFSYKDYEQGDSDCTDVAIFEVDEGDVERVALIPSETIFDLDTEPPPPGKRDLLLSIHGFPKQTNPVDYEKKALFLQRLSIGAVFERWADDSSCIIVRLTTDGGVIDHDGFSGAPVFFASSEFDQLQESVFLGIVLRGTKPPREKSVLPVINIKHLIDQKISEDAKQEI